MRTGTVSYKLEDLKKGVIIPIGFVGENDFTKVFFDAEEIYKKYPNASVSMKVQPPKGGIYPATVTRDGNTVIWQVKEADVANRGGGELQLTFIDGETKIKTYIAKTDVKRSLAGNGPAPDPIQDFVDNANEKLAEVDDALEDLAAMDNIAKNAQESDIGKALSPKTVEDGVVTEWEYITPGGGTEDYTDLENKPSIAGVTLSGNKSLTDLGIASEESLGELSGEVTNVKNAIDGITDINKAIVTLFQHTAFTDAEGASAYETLYNLVYGATSQYQKVAYVQTDGASRINTGVQFDGTKDIEITLELSFNGSIDSNESILNGWNAGGAVGVSRVGGRSSGYWSDGDLPRENDLFHVDEMTTCVMTIKAGSSAQTISVFTNNYGTATLSRSHPNVANRTYLDFPLFALSKQDSFDFVKSGMRIKSAEIKIGDDVVRSMYACYRISDGEIGFYDTINNVFYTNAGTGNFTKGGDIS